MLLHEIKIIAALAILAVAVVGGLIPLLVAREQGSRRFLSLGNALAGGIFLGAGFIHLLAESGETLEGLVDYPLAPLLAAGGVVLLLLIDRVLLESRVRNAALNGEAYQPIYPLILLIVLSVHSIIAGIALGIESDVAATTLFMVAILFHKGSAAFALTVSARAAGADQRRLWTILIIFSAMTPLGIAFGSVTSDMFEARPAAFVEGCFGALAAGTFIHVAILDIINAEMNRLDDHVADYAVRSLAGERDLPKPMEDPDRLLKFALIFSGLASMAVIAIWV